MFFTFHSSSFLTIMKSDDSFHCSFNEFAEFNCNRFNANTLYIFIVDDNFNQYIASITTRILKDFSILLFNFLNNLKVMMFLEFKNIILLIL